MKKFFLLAFLIIIFSVNLIAEEKPFDSGRSSTKALLWSIIPGGGQFYNKQYVKAGIDILAESLIIGTAIHYHLKMIDAYALYEQTHSQAHYDQYNYYYQQQQNMVWWWATVKLLSLLDAYIDAKMFNYNEKMKKLDLEFEGLGMSLRYNF
ncbi:MAG: hypothetical protein J7M10_08900 [Candidatus Cloacimonetes bacterium]|nr:hypothetical protein [Candidatus Cloacimonadota bacterium]